MSLRIATSFDIALGGERKRFDRTSFFTVGDQVLDKLVTLHSGGVAASQATIYDSTIDTYASSWSSLILIVDPDNGYADSSATPVVACDLVGDSVSMFAFQVRREFPFMLGSRYAEGPAGSGLNGSFNSTAITQVRVRNNSLLADGTANVTVRLLLFA